MNIRSSGKIRCGFCIRLTSRITKIQGTFESKRVDEDDDEGEYAESVLGDAEPLADKGLESNLSMAGKSLLSLSSGDIGLTPLS